MIVLALLPPLAERAGWRPGRLTSCRCAVILGSRSSTMLLTESQSQSDTSRLGMLGRLALKVHGQTGDYDVHLVAERTTIGSSPRCDIRIEQPGVQPLHCLIVCSKGEWSVCCWAAGVLKNGQPFDEAPLAVGDRLSLGAVDLEVVEETFEKRAGDSASDSQLGSEAARWGDETVHHTTVWISESEEDSARRSGEKVEEALEPQGDCAIANSPEGEVIGDIVRAEPARQVFRQLQEANATSRSRCRRLLDALRTSRGEERALFAQVLGLTNTKDELVAEQSASARERNLLREQLAAAEQRLAEWDDRSNQWDELQKRWEAVRSNWDNERADWERERAEWTRQVRDWEARLAGHSDRIKQLEAQLAEAQSAREEQAVVVPTPSTSVPEVAKRSNDSLNHTESAGDVEDTDDSPHDLALLPRAEESEAMVPTQQSAGPAESPAWERHKPSWDSDLPSSEDDSLLPAEHSPVWDDRNQDPDTEFPEELPEKPETDDTSPSGQQVESAGSAAVAIAPPEETRDENEELPTATSENRQPTSFLERFAHLLRAEETPGQSHEPTFAPREGAGDFVDRAQNGPVDRGDDVGAAQSPSEDEDSIEEYMAKLMQRLRGEQPHVAASQSSSPRPTEPRPKPTPSPVAEQTHSNGASDASSLDAKPEGPLTDLSEMVRSAPAARPTNLDALRALANESARQAIGAHTSKQKLRDAVTKFMVASLAGITSVWLMMLAPTWHDLQFIAACVALLIAAYWAGQAYAALVEMHRASECDSPEHEKKMDRTNPQQAASAAPEPSVGVVRAHGG
jgi:hypothetical protein